MTTNKKIYSEKKQDLHMIFIGLENKQMIMPLDN